MKEKTKKIIKRILGTILVLVVAFIIVKILYENWSKLKDYSFQFNPLLLILSFLLLIIYFLLSVYGWKRCLKLLGIKIKYLKTAGIWFSSQLMRYIPGNIWFVFGRTEQLKKEEFPREITVLSSVIETIFILMGSATLFLVYILFILKQFYLIIPLIILGLIFLHPKILLPITNFFLKIIKKPKLEIKIKYWKMLLLYLYYASIQILEGLAFALLVSSFVKDVPFLILIAIFEGAWILGYLTFLTPSGLGAREGFMILLLKPYFPIEICVMISLISRIQWVILEVVIALPIILIPKIKSKKLKRKFINNN